MPWPPELFSAPLLAAFEQKREHELVSVPYFEGMIAGEPDALVDSFAGEPELHDPVRGRVKGTQAFRTFVSETSDWLRRHDASVEGVAQIVTERHGFEEVVLQLDAQGGRVGLPVAIVGDHRSDNRLAELRIYYSSWPLSERHANRPPLLQPDPKLRESNVVGDYQRALAAGDVGAIVDTFEADGYVREPAGGAHLHVGRDGLRSFYEQLFSNGGRIPLEHCHVIDDGRLCALEYNVVHWGRTQLPPEAGVAIYARGPSGRLAAARIYDDADPPIGPGL
jgi:hypothetical protein